MTDLTTRLELFLPEGTDPFPDTVSEIANWERLDDVVGVVVCTSLTRPSTPFAGQPIYETDTRLTYVRNALNSAWVQTGAVTTVNATGDITAPVNGQIVFSVTGFSLYRYMASTTSWARYPDDQSPSSTQATSGTTTSASYVNTLTGGTACGVTFVAPPSGKVEVVHNLWLAASATTQNAVASIRVRAGASIGSGTDHLAASDANACVGSTTGFTGSSRVTLVTGLTAHASYNVQEWFKSSSGTATFSNKELYVTSL